MKGKNLIAGLLSSTVCLTMLTACSANEASPASSPDSSPAASVQSETNHNQSSSKDSSAEKLYTLTIRDADKHEAITAHFFNSNSGQSKAVEMKKAEEKEDYLLYTAEADVNSYNMVRLSYGEDETDDVSFNEFVSGWSLKDDGLLPYAKGQEPTYDPRFETKVFSFNGYDKNVYIWTPTDYDANAAEKYDTIYMLDGQAVLSLELTGEASVWNVSECVESMMAATDHKAILVNIEAGEEQRSEEMTIDIGGKYEDDPIPVRNGAAFSGFICDTVMPYIQQNYNVYSDASHTALAGSSMGGLAAFCFGLDHPEKFGTVGVFSPSFWTDEEDVWKQYLSSKDFSKSPFLYFYCGSFGLDMGNLSELMFNSLLEAGYPNDKLVFHKNENGLHQILFWRGVYSEFLEAVFTKKVTGLESGKEVTYIDRTPPKLPSAEPIENDDRPASITNYIFYDNSQTKWENVYAYWWGGETVNKVTGEDRYGKMWPGLQMEKLEGTDIYRIAVPLNATFIIFNSGITDDEIRKGVIGYQTIDLPFSHNGNAGQIYTIDVSEAPKHMKGVEKTKYKYSSGSWSNYEG